MKFRFTSFPMDHNHKKVVYFLRHGESTWNDGTQQHFSFLIPSPVTMARYGVCVCVCVVSTSGDVVTMMTNRDHPLNEVCGSLGNPPSHITNICVGDMCIQLGVSQATKFNEAWVNAKTSGEDNITI